MQSYKTSLANSTNSDSLKSEQRAWLTNIRNKCQDSACLKQVYSERISTLDGTTAPTITLASNNPAQPSQLESGASPIATEQPKATTAIEDAFQTSGTNDSSTVQSAVSPASELQAKAESNTQASLPSSTPVKMEGTLSKTSSKKLEADGRPDSSISDLFQFLSLLIGLLIIIGLVKPAWVLRWDKSPTRLKIFGYLFPIGLIFGGVSDITKTDARKTYEVQISAEKKAAKETERDGRNLPPSNAQQSSRKNLSVNQQKTKMSADQVNKMCVKLGMYANAYGLLKSRNQGIGHLFENVDEEINEYPPAIRKYVGNTWQNMIDGVNRTSDLRIFIDARGGLALTNGCERAWKRNGLVY